MQSLRGFLRSVSILFRALVYVFSITIGWFWRTQIVLHPKRTIETIHQANPPKRLEVLSGPGCRGIFVTDGTDVCTHFGFNTGRSFLYQGHTHPVNAVSSHFTMFSVASVDAGGALHIWTYTPWLVGEREPIRYQTHPAYALKAVAFKPIAHKESCDAQEAASRAGYAKCFPISMANEVAIGGESDQVQLFSTHKRTVIATYPLPPSTMVTCLQWSPDLNYLAAGGYTSNEHKGVIRVWKAQTGLEVCTYWHHPQAVNALAWSPDSTQIASGSDDTTVQVWDVSTGERTLTYRGHTHPVTSICWDKPNHYSEYCFPSEQIISSSQDHTVQAWHSRTGRRTFTHRHRQAVTSVCWDGDYISSGSEDGTIDLYIGTLSPLWSILYPLIYGKAR